MMRRRKMTKGATTTKIESMYVEYQKRLAKKNYSIALTLARAAYSNYVEMADGYFFTCIENSLLLVLSSTISPVQSHE